MYVARPEIENPEMGEQGVSTWICRRALCMYLFSFTFLPPDNLAKKRIEKMTLFCHSRHGAGISIIKKAAL
jgi:hypothetical protein